MKESDKVRIKKHDIVGVIVDIYEVNGTKHFSVESDERNVSVEGGYGKEFPIFNCLADELEMVER